MNTFDLGDTVLDRRADNSGGGFLDEIGTVVAIDEQADPPIYYVLWRQRQGTGSTPVDGRAIRRIDEEEEKELCAKARELWRRKALRDFESVLDRICEIEDRSGLDARFDFRIDVNVTCLKPLTGNIHTEIKL